MSMPESRKFSQRGSKSTLTFVPSPLFKLMRERKRGEESERVGLHGRRFLLKILALNDMLA